MQTAWSIGEDFATHWYFSYNVWLWTGEIFGIFIAVGSLITASHPSFIAKYVDIRLIAFLVATVASINAFLDPLGRAKVFGQALAALDVELNGLQIDLATNADQKVIDEALERMKIAAAPDFWTAG